METVKETIAEEIEAAVNKIRSSAESEDQLEVVSCFVNMKHQLKVNILN